MATENIVDKQETVKNQIVANKNKDDNPKVTEVDFDDLLSSAGKFGPYQMFLFFCTFPFYVYGVFAYFSQLFMTQVSPNHWCWIPELENLTEIERRNLAIPLEENSRFGYSQCSAYVANWSDILITGQKPNQSWSTVACQHGWEFNKSEIPYPTIASELGWVCEKDSYQATAQAIFFVGSVAGGFLIGWIADRFGRLPAAVASNMIGCVAGVLSIFTTNFGEFAVCRFLMGMSYDNCMIMVYLLVLEYMSPKYRTVIANMPCAFFYTIGVTALPWISLACGHWKIISLATSLPMALSLLAPFIIPESPRWLLSKGRVNDAINKVNTIAKVNKKEIPPKLLEQFKLSTSREKKEERRSVLDLLKRPLLRKMFICSCLQYMCCLIVFDALVRTIDQLEYDFFISFSVISFTEFPSLILVSFILDITGRKWLTITVMLTSCLFSILTAFIGGGLPSVMCAVVARFAVNMAVNTSMQWAAEMMPTPVRGSGVSIIHICGYIANVVSPFIAYLEIAVYWLPLVLVGCVAGLAALITLMLPETAKKDMPQTFDEAEDLVRNQSLCDAPCFRKKDKGVGHVNDSFEM